MTTYVFIDTVMHVYESDGNLHIVGGIANGQVDTNGKDILEKTLHLTMPMQKAQKILPDIAESIPKVSSVETTQRNLEAASTLEKSNEFEGQGLHFKI